MTEKETLAYLAGFFDGEGSITIVVRSLRVNIAQVNPRPLMMLRNRFGGQIAFVKRSDKNPRHRDIHVLNITSYLAAEMLRQLRPYLIVKADQADLAIEYQARMHTGVATAEENGYREWAKVRMTELNTKRNFLDTSTTTPVEYV